MRSDKQEYQKTIGYVGVMSDGGVIEHVRNVESWEERAFNLALKFYSAGKHEGKPLAVIPKALASFRDALTGNGWGKHSKGACEYVAVKFYLQNLFGITLSSEDEDWFQENPFVEAAGTPMSHALQVAQQLVEPYHLRISRVRALPGVSLPGQTAHWPLVLGINPMGMMDGNTSNKEFAAQTGMDLDEVNRAFRFEFSEERMTPCVVCGVHDLKGGIPGGHAEYASPRSKPMNVLHTLQFQFDREERVEWLAEPKYDERDADAEAGKAEDTKSTIVSLFLSRDPQGKEFCTYTTDGDTKKTSSSKAVVKKGGGEETTTTLYAAPKGDGDCFVCGATRVKLGASHVCETCWGLVWGGYRCSDVNCGAQFDESLPIFSGVRKDGDGSFALLGACPVCGRMYALKVKLDDVMATVVKNAIYGKRATKEDQRFVAMIRRRQLIQ